MDFEFLTLHGLKFKGRVQEVMMQTPEGMVTVLPHHEPFTAAVLPGPFHFRPSGGGKTETYAVFGGIFEIRDNSARMMADDADHAWELIAEEIEAAIAKAEDLKANTRTRADLHRAHELLDRHYVRLEVARLRHRSHLH